MRIWGRYFGINTDVVPADIVVMDIDPLSSSFVATRETVQRLQSLVFLPVEPTMAPEKNDISITNGYIKLDIMRTILPLPEDCSEGWYTGRMVLDEVTGNLWICTGPSNFCWMLK